MNKNKMKKIIFLSLLSIIFWSTYSINLNWCYKKYFKVSAYYSPIPRQNIYYMWSYWAEIKLNWKWIRWASWKKVFNGMLAWPKDYKFWTKIYFPWLWVGQIEDRWNAIVSAWNKWQKYDRIDIWVWKWDKALMRALSFWKNVRVWYICPKYKKIKVWFNYNKFPIFPNFFQKTIWWIWLFLWRNDAWVKVLQTYLKKLWYFHYRTTWYFWPITKKAIIEFQKDNWIKTRYYGYFWPKTRQKLKDILIKKWLHKKNEKNIIKTKNASIQKIKKIEKIKKAKQTLKKNKKIRKDLAILGRWLSWWDHSYEVKILQTYLKKLWYFHYKTTWYFWTITLKAVIEFQKDNWIDTRYYGYFWPKTRQKLKDILIKKLLHKKDKTNVIKTKNTSIQKIKKAEKTKKDEKIRKNLAILRRWLSWWDHSYEVKILQTYLKKLWYFKWKINWYYNEITLKAVAQFQFKYNIISKQNFYLAGYFGPKTRNIFKKTIKEKFIDL